MLALSDYPGDDRPGSARRSIVAMALGAATGLLAAVLIFGGGWLATLGGSLYYLLIGAAYSVAAYLLLRSKSRGGWILIAGFVGTLLWSLAEAGAAFWPLVPRLVIPGLLAIAGGVVVALRPSGRADRRLGLAAAGMVGAGLLSLFGFAFVPHGATYGIPAPANMSNATTQPVDWTSYGGGGGTRFSPAAQVTPTNVSKLKVAWIYRTGDFGPGEDQTTPLQVGSLVYHCARNDRVAALDADTGAVKWRFDPKATSPAWQRCRGLGYHAATGATGLCARRIIQTTIDARLIALDAATGRPCPGFGQNGIVSLTEGMGEVLPGFYFMTSAPTVVGNLIIIGGWVRDNQETGEPSGVIRAFDVTTGQLTWAWDLGNPAANGAPPAGKTYTRGTPNMWSTPSFDEGLGLLYIPLGNATPDYYGAKRSAASERYSSSVVALDIASGRERWRFQTVHHDLWDYDVAPQPALVDVPNGKGGTTPALLQATKRGLLFLLDRRTGKSLTPIEERAVPQEGKTPSEYLAKTQPYPVGMPSIGTAPLNERRMWGMTMLDQLWCRIHFRGGRYAGDFTPPGTTRSIQWPGNYGGFNWGGTSYDPSSGYAYLTDIRLPSEVTLRSHAEVEEIIRHTKHIGNRHGPARQLGTPYGVTIYPMMSPLGIPCNEPPFGTMTAVDLKTRKIAWQIPMGTVRDTGPLGLVTHLPMPIGMPTLAGSLTTGSGLVFFAGTQDFALRAMDARTGKELWQGRLPVGSSATPMTYISRRSGKQYVVISAGGAGQSDLKGDYLIAYAL
ncbi:membrane-bound PQQ-dependent dehydrogenase, glucose/quinate/shikimate family [Sphingobium yanoikuyae]|uniref:membrane-bound PQQ-dependent dehydrogenase, glucose/quinate/shikimate family n=1 Tax=Sphingobium yanoikuyae TaxID=13690 RepID=UPI000B1098E9|nr:membrane-bound PQQ-dependent dehydrogenase, glucose/quinate/shikimate family [Sphingobium yanoikuyae]